MVKIGIASSVSSLYSYNPLDTLEYFAEKHLFENIQIYLSESYIHDTDRRGKMIEKINSLSGVSIYYHLEGNLNTTLFENKEYLNQVEIIANQTHHKGFVLHYDHSPELMDYRKIINFLTINNLTPLWLENYFFHDNTASYRQQLDKYLSIFSLYSKYFKLFPALDIPRFYHSGNGITPQDATRDVFIAFNLFREMTLPLLLHIIDVSDFNQGRNDFCVTGKGLIPYESIIKRLKTDNLRVEDIILEFEDKIKPIESFHYLQKLFKSN